MIVIINYGLGNLGSIFNMLKKVGAEAKISSAMADIQNADKLILPGVGAFDYGMQKLNESGLQEIINKKVNAEKVPVLGICLGMQLLMNKSAEGKLPGLGWVNGAVCYFGTKLEKNRLKIPHMGWNTITKVRDHPMLSDLPEDPRFYFVHSYYIECDDQSDVLATTNYGFDFHAVIAHENILGVQFHPEKSHKFGMQILRNFAEKI